MHFVIEKALLHEADVNTLIYFYTEKKLGSDKQLGAIDKVLNGTIKAIYDSGEFTGKLNQSAVIHTSGRLPYERLILAGVGPKAGLNADCYRQAAGTISILRAVLMSDSLGMSTGDITNSEYARAAVEGLMLGGFILDEYKTGKKSESKTDTVKFFVPTASLIKKTSKDVEIGAIVGEGAILTRILSVLPGNDLTPKKFALRAQNLAKKYGFSCRVLDEKQIKAERMDAFYGVARGSDEPPRFVILEYNGGRPKSKPVVLVGKGITFDSGGISLKPGLDMHEMKSDMTGGACVLTAVMTAARLGIKQNVVGLIPLAENLPSGVAQKPGDIVTSRSGKTVEIINTDAEGRLILIDALDYANEFNPQAVINICTLTGGAMYILGYWGALLMGNNDRLKDIIRTASEASAEKVWELPIWDEHRVWMESAIADLRNSGGKPATSITAAAFLEACIGNWPWAHIDIASVDIASKNIKKYGKTYIPKGHTGFGFRLLVETLLHWKKV